MSRRTSMHAAMAASMAAGLMASLPNGVQAIESAMNHATRRSRASHGRTIHGVYDGPASNSAANTKRALKRAMGARQLKKMQRAARQKGAE